MIAAHDCTRLRERGAVRFQEDVNQAAERLEPELRSGRIQIGARGLRFRHSNYYRSASSKTFVNHFADRHRRGVLKCTHARQALRHALVEYISPMAQDHHPEEDRSAKSRILRLFKFLFEINRL